MNAKTILGNALVGFAIGLAVTLSVAYLVGLANPAEAAAESAR